MNKQALEDLRLKLAEPVSEAGYELLDVDFIQDANGRALRFYIYHPDGIGIEDCEKVNDVLNPLLDEIDPVSGAYNLEVSSPDLNRPLSNDRYLEIYLGQELEFTFYGSYLGAKVLRGDLLAYDDKAYQVLVRDLDLARKKGKKKDRDTDPVGQTVLLERDQVASVKVALNF